MRKYALLGSLFTLVIVFSAQAVPPNRPHPRIKKVEVVNLPATQEVSGAVEVTNLPPVQDVFVTNPPSSEGCGAAMRFQLVGYTLAQVPGDVTRLGLNRACQAEFPESRLCSSVEIMETVSTGAAIGLINGPAWVRAVPRTMTGYPSIVGASGAVRSGSFSINCGQWSSVEQGLFGLTVNESGAFRFDTCSAPRDVACCALGP